MESISSLQTPPNQVQQPQTQQPNSSRNLKIWFDEFKAKVSKKNQPTQASEQGQTEETPLAKSIKENSTITPTTSTTKVKSSNLKIRKFTKISTSESPNFDTASIRTIFNRRDSRYEALSVQRQQRSLLVKILSLFKCTLAYLIPFDYNLPWKLLCIVNSSFVIIVIGIVTGSSQTTSTFNFINGFIGGLASALVCLIILILSFMIQVLPKSHEIIESGQEPLFKRHIKPRSDTSFIEDVNCSIYNNDRKTSPTDLSQTKLGDFSLFGILDENDEPKISSELDPTVNLENSVESKLDYEDYRGWMIEFIGDYEQRNTADIKLKSIYVRIENRLLYLCKPKNNHDTDSSALPVFANQRVYDLSNVRKFSITLLIPKTVRNKQKYVWSKKYPIRLGFQDDGCTSEAIGTSSRAVECSKQIQLTLFAKSCREKEEWFRRFKRIAEENRLSQGQQSLKRSSIKSEELVCNESINESFFGSLKRFRRRSPSPKSHDSVQTSQSFHLLNESRQASTEDPSTKISSRLQDLSSSPSSGLTRTKSCELLPNDKLPETDGDISNENSQDRINDDSGSRSRAFPADDSTLTRETAELFSQAMEFSNFIECQPTLNYQEYIERVIELGQEATPTSDWFNALTGRIFYDVFSHNYWSIWFKRKIQRKLYRIRLPYFMETLTLTKIDLGTNAPQFLNVVSHSFDSYGLSIDFDMSYSGGLSMTFETKLNLLKIKSDNSSTSNGTTGYSSSVNNSSSSSATTASGVCPGSDQQQQDDLMASKDANSTKDSSFDNIHKPGLSSTPSTRTSGDSSDSDDSDSNSSSDSSFDEAEANEISDWEDYGAEKTRQNIVKFVDKIASSRYFQHATENRFIKRKLQDISNCPLVLVVQIQSLNGVLTLNVPPPQTDRIWYGFKPMPELTLKAMPKMGDREVSLTHVTDWIEKKLAEEFKKILVIPNMEDVVLPVLKSDHLQYVAATR